MPTFEDDLSTKQATEQYFSLFDGSDEGIKRAEDIGSKEITKLLVKEEEIVSKLIPPTDVADSEIVVTPESDQPRVLHWLEKAVPAVLECNIGEVPDEVEMFVDRYWVTGQPYLSPRFMKWDQELRVYPFSIKQLFADNIVKELGYAKDRNFFNGVDTLLVGANSNMAWSGSPQWITVSGGWTKANIVYGLQLLYKTQRNVPPEVIVCNTPTLMNFITFTRDEAGGDIAEEFFKNGFAERQLFGHKWYGTIKRHLVGDGTFYQFAAPKFIGRHRVFQQPKMYVKYEYHKYMMQADAITGLVIANDASIARVDITA